MNQNITLPSVIISFLANFWNIFGNWFFIYKMGLGFSGSPIATSSSRIFMLVALYLYHKWFISPKGILHTPLQPLPQTMEEDNDQDGEDKGQLVDSPNTNKWKLRKKRRLKAFKMYENVGDESSLIVNEEEEKDELELVQLKTQQHDQSPSFIQEDEEDDVENPMVFDDQDVFQDTSNQTRNEEEEIEVIFEDITSTPQKKSQNGIDSSSPNNQDYENQEEEEEKGDEFNFWEGVSKFLKLGIFGGIMLVFLFHCFSSF